VQHGAGEQARQHRADAEMIARHRRGEGDQRQRQEQRERGEQPRVVALRQRGGDEMGEQIAGRDGEEAQAHDRPAACQHRRERARDPHRGDVDRGDEREGNRTTRRIVEADLPAQEAAEGVAPALGVDAVFLELVQEIGEHDRPGQPDHVAPARDATVAAQGIGRQQEQKQPRGAEADPGPDMGEREHSREAIAVVRRRIDHCRS